MMKPKAQNEHDEGLLEYLEDIIGSNRFVEQTEEAAKEVEALSELRLEKLNRLKVAEKEQENLEDARQEAEAFLTKEREIRHKFNALYQLSVHEAATNVTTVEQKAHELSERRTYEQTKLAEHESQLAEMQSAFDVDSAEHDALNAELKRAQDEFAAFERKDIAFREQIKHQKASVKKLEATIKREEKKASELQGVAQERGERPARAARGRRGPSRGAASTRGQARRGAGEPQGRDRTAARATRTRADGARARAARARRRAGRTHGHRHRDRARRVGRDIGAAAAGGRARALGRGRPRARGQAWQTERDARRARELARADGRGFAPS